MNVLFLHGRASFILGVKIWGTAAGRDLGRHAQNFNGYHSRGVQYYIYLYKADLENQPPISTKCELYVLSK